MKTKPQKIEKRPCKEAGALLRHLRIEAKLSQGDVSREFGWNTRGTFIANLEAGRVFLPIRYIPKMARIMGVGTLVLRSVYAKAEIAQVKKKYGIDKTNKEKK